MRWFGVRRQWAALEQLEPQAFKDLQVLLVQKVLQVLLAPKVLLVLLVLLEFEGLLVLPEPGPLVRLAQLVLQGYKALQVQLVHKV